MYPYVLYCTQMIDNLPLPTQLTELRTHGRYMKALL
jgi:hypothetical protein